MCGIVGTVNKKFDNSVLDLIKHRGPDDSEIINLNIENNEIILGHRRLSIQDLSNAGHQPMYSACANFVLIFNGEIYNHLELRKELKEVKFNGHSDTETIVNYIAKFGIKSIEKFNGIFGFSLLDILNKKLYIARDRYGVKPIYYYNTNNTFMYSSEIKPLLKLTKQFSIDENSLNTYLTLRFNPAPKTIIKNIFKLSPGEVLEYNLNTHSLKPSFNINSFICKNIQTNTNKNEEYWIDSVSDVLEQAIHRQVLSDVEVGSFLSGGIDSALITAIASKYSKNTIKTFCVGFEGASKKDDEIDEARISSNILGTDHYDVIINPNDYYSKYLKKSIYMLEEPNGSAATFAQHEVSALASQYVKVALAGQGADEIFMGYPKYYAEIQRDKFAIPLFLAGKLKHLFKLLNNDKINRALYSLTEKNEKSRYIKTRAVFTEEEKKLFLRNYSFNKFEEFDFYFKNINTDLHSVDKFSAVDTYTQLADELLMYGDKTTMATSLEMRVPFLDNDLVNLAQSIPNELKIKNGIQKYILKKVARKFLPDEIINRRKKGFAMPILQWFQDDLQENLLIDLVEKDAFVHKYIEKKAIKNLISSYKNKQEKDYRKLLLILHFNTFGALYEDFH